MATTPGYKGKVTIGGVELTACYADVDIDPKAEIKDISCKGPQGRFKVKQFGQEDATVKITLHWDPDEDPTESPPNFQQGQVIEDLKFYPDRDEPRYWYADELLIVNTPLSSKNADITMFEMNAESSGRFGWAG
jgi:hypothetical protein